MENMFEGVKSTIDPTPFYYLAGAIVALGIVLAVLNRWLPKKVVGYIGWFGAVALVFYFLAGLTGYLPKNWYWPLT